jgi:hypothetical protein
VKGERGEWASAKIYTLVADSNVTDFLPTEWLWFHIFYAAAEAMSDAGCTSFYPPCGSAPSLTRGMTRVQSY